LRRVMPRGVLVGCLAPSGSATEELTPLPLSRYTTLSSASRRAVCPPRAPRRARFPRPPSWRLFLSLAGNSEEMVNSTFPCPIGTFFTQTHSPESRAPGRRPCEEAVGRPLGHLPLDVHWGAFFRFPLHRRMKED